jgi:oligoribonuclease
MHANPNNLIWIDLEMTGLSPASDRIIEIAMVITDSELTVVAESPVLAIFQTEDIIAGMDEWNTKHHHKSGLIERVRMSTLDEAAVEAMMLEFLNQCVPKDKSPMCGNSICQDRRFLANYMPKLERHFHYRNLDVSTLKELAKRWQPDIAKAYKKKSKHQALADIYDSIDELKYYREHLFK